MTKQLIAGAALLTLFSIAQIGVIAAQNSPTSGATVIHGSVTDPSGAVIPAAMVTISNGLWNRTLSTDEAGQFSASGLAPGHYRVRVHFGGFSVFDRGNFVVTAGHETEVNAQLEVHETHQAVTVYE